MPSELAEVTKDLLGKQQQQARHPGSPPQACTAHTPAASKSFLSMRSERRQSRPWAPAILCSRSSLGMGSSESHCSTSQLKTKGRPLRSGQAPQVPTGPQSSPATSTDPVRVENIVFCLLWPQAAWGWLRGVKIRWGQPQNCSEGG